MLVFLTKLKIKTAIKIQKFKEKLKDKRYSRQFFLSLISLCLIALSLLLFFLLQEKVVPGQRFAVPNDDGEITIKTQVRRGSPLYPGVMAYKKGYTYKAIDLFRGALKKKLSDKEKKKIYNYLGNIYLKLKKYSKSEKSFRNSLNITEDNPPALHGIGRVYQILKKPNLAKKYLKKALDVNPKFLKSLKRLGEIYSGFNDYKKAILYYKKYLKIKNNPYIRYLTAKSYLSKGDRKSAESYFNSILDLTSSRILLAYTSARLGDIKEGKGKIGQAIMRYKLAIDYYPGHSVFSYNIGVLYLKKGLLKNAIGAFKSAFKNSGSNDSDMAKTIGELYYDAQNFDSAIYYFKIAAKNAKDMDVIAVLADLYYKKKHFKKALMYYKLIIDNIPESERAVIAMVNSGNIYINFQNYDKAIEYYKAAAKKDKKNSSILYNMGIALWYKGLLRQAASKFISSYSLNPANKKALYSAAHIYKKQRKYKLALNLLLNALDGNPSAHPDMYSQTAKIYFMMGKNKSSLKYYKLALRLAKDSRTIIKIYHGLARVLLSEKKINKVYNILKKAHLINPDNPFTHYLYGLTHLMDHRITNAFDSFKTALMYRPQDNLKSEILFNIGNLLFKKNNYKEALSYYKKVILIRPDHAGASYNATQCVKNLQ